VWRHLYPKSKHWGRTLRVRPRHFRRLGELHSWRTRFSCRRLRLLDPEPGRIQSRQEQ